MPLDLLRFCPKLFFCLVTCFLSRQILKADGKVQFKVQRRPRAGTACRRMFFFLIVLTMDFNLTANAPLCQRYRGNQGNCSGQIDIDLTAVDCLWVTSWQTPFLANAGIVMISMGTRKVSRKNLRSATEQHLTVAH